MNNWNDRIRSKSKTTSSTITACMAVFRFCDWTMKQTIHLSGSASSASLNSIIHSLSLYILGSVSARNRSGHLNPPMFWPWDDPFYCPTPLSPCNNMFWNAWVLQFMFQSLENPGETYTDMKRWYKCSFERSWPLWDLNSKASCCEAKLNKIIQRLPLSHRLFHYIVKSQDFPWPPLNS